MFLAAVPGLRHRLKSLCHSGITAGADTKALEAPPGAGATGQAWRPRLRRLPV